MTRKTANKRKEAMNNSKNSVKETVTARKFRKLAKDTRGAELVEYIVLVGAVALASVAAYQGFSGKVGTKIQGLGDTVTKLPGSGG
jgi:Flp pilus assembly pilin Flp